MANLNTVPRDVVFYLVPDFDILSFGGALEVFRLTNLVLGYQAYSWRLLSADGSDVGASCGLDIRSFPPSLMPQNDRMYLPAESLTVDAYAVKLCWAWRPAANGTGQGNPTGSSRPIS
ncbi:hypothetical protein [Mesorhizobium sp. M0909]|uniref:hypothetical protein n=1 Tax=Mesorhizobium sp. M0909 TaxID=2957024 RepID=UPI0033387CBD